MMPPYLKNFIKKFLLLLAAFSVIRIVFYFANNTQFSLVSISDFIVGIWFDAITVSILFLPLGVIELMPNFWRSTRWYKRVLKVFYFLMVIPSIIINIADIAYFKFISTRSTFSTFKMLSYGSDFTNQLPSFIIDYWLLLLLLIAIIIAIHFTFDKWTTNIKAESKLSAQIIGFVVGFIVLISLGRGWGLRPMAPIHASQYTSDRNAPLVLNSAFTVLKSAGKKTLKPKQYFKDGNIAEWFNPIKQYSKQATLEKPNIVVILLESFSTEYIGNLNSDTVSYTPFLDSLIDQGLVFENCFANGKKSIDAVPSVISSIPKLMPEEFISSTYASNQITSLSEILENIGYESTFYHGATNGSMNFDGFASKAKYTHYKGRKEYNNNNHFDGTWGIFDHFFLPWTAKEMTGTKKPFFSTIFSLSSHPPYRIPEKLQSRFSGGPTKMHNAVRYADYSLGKFFEAAKEKDWYENTLFVITADHTPASTNPLYFNDRGIMSIPLLFFHPTNNELRGRSTKIVGQIDIMPSILDLIGYQSSFFSFGESVFSDKPGFTATQLGDKYLVYAMDHFMVFQNGKVIRMYHIDDKTLSHTLLKEKPELVKVLKNKLLSLIQTYHNGMINNNLKAQP